MSSRGLLEKWYDVRLSPNAIIRAPYLVSRSTDTWASHVTLSAFEEANVFPDVLPEFIPRGILEVGHHQTNTYRIWSKILNHDHQYINSSLEFENWWEIIFDLWYLIKRFNLTNVQKSVKLVYEFHKPEQVLSQGLTLTLFQIWSHQKTIDLQSWSSTQTRLSRQIQMGGSLVLSSFSLYSIQTKVS